jgi:transcriptional regulator GlxA family with amidase domain
MDRSQTIVAVLAFDHISPFHLSVPCAVFGDMVQGFEVRVCAMAPGIIHTTAGFTMTAQFGLQGLDDADVIVIPSWHDVSVPPPQSLVDALLVAHARGATLVGLCLGAYVLAATGLLDGKQATTHWAFAEDFSKRFPSVGLDANVLYIDEKTLITSAGTAAGIDCCLHLLRERLGSAAANRVARRLVVAPHRQGGQAQFIELPIPERVGDKRLAELMTWMKADLAQDHRIDALAKRALMSRRSLTRHFLALTGLSVGQWLLQERLRYAQQLLEGSHHSIEAISRMCGFGSPVSMRHHFQQVFSTSPSQWRQTFAHGA